MTPDRDPDTTQAVPRHTGTGHVPAVDPALAELRRRFAEGMSKPPLKLLIPRHSPFYVFRVSRLYERYPGLREDDVGQIEKMRERNLGADVKQRFLIVARNFLHESVFSLLGVGAPCAPGAPPDGMCLAQPDLGTKRKGLNFGRRPPCLWWPNVTTNWRRRVYRAWIMLEQCVDHALETLINSVYYSPVRRRFNRCPGRA